MSHPDVCIFAAEEAEAKVTEQTFDKRFFYPHCQLHFGRVWLALRCCAMLRVTRLGKIFAHLEMIYFVTLVSFFYFRSSPKS
jgi:hypothetical protein